MCDSAFQTIDEQDPLEVKQVSIQYIVHAKKIKNKKSK